MHLNKLRCIVIYKRPKDDIEFLEKKELYFCPFYLHIS